MTSARPINFAISDVAELAFFLAVIEHSCRHAPKCVGAVSLSDSQLTDGLRAVTSTTPLAATLHSPPAASGIAVCRDTASAA